MSKSLVLGRPLPFWTRFALIWLMAITLSGALVRLTGSGLGCLDWPNCTANEELDAPGFHATIEFGNRVISGLAILPVFAAWLIARRTQRHLLGVLWLLVAGFMGQVILGMLVTRTHLDPRMVLGHFLLSIVLIFLAVVLDFRARHTSADTQSLSPTDRDAARFAKRHGWLLVAIATAVIFVGTLVTGSGPHTGSESDGEPIPRLGFAIREITRLHGVMAWILIVTILYGLYRYRSATDPAGMAHRRWFTVLGGIAVAQGAVGYLQYLTGVPVGLVAVHIAGSVLLWTAISWYALWCSAALQRPVDTEGTSPVPELIP